MTAAPTLVDERYQILGEIGAGSFATVYRARETETGIVVALKLLRHELRSDAAAVERFRREALAVKNISSSYVVKLFDFGVSGSDIYIAMELVEGTLLRDLIGDPFSADDVHVIVGQVGEALTAAHGRNIVHRDLKPENIILVRDKHGKRQVKVLDFGFAKLEELERRRELEPLTAHGMTFGTPQYMSPEQIRGEPVDRGCDLYACGVLIYEMITGELPWTGADPRQIFLKVLESPPPKVTRTHPGITRRAELDAFFTRALAKRPEERPADAAALFRELELALFVTPARPKPKLPFASITGKTIEIEPLPSEQPFEQEEMIGARPAGPATERVAPIPRPQPPNVTPPGVTSASVTSPGVSPIAKAPVVLTPSLQLRTMTQVTPPPPNRLRVGILLLILAAIVMGAAGYWLGTLSR